MSRDDAADRTSTDQRSADLDALRAVAALLVVVAHSRQLTFATSGEVLGQNAAVTGVGLFFALSGMLIGGPFIRALLSGGQRPKTAPYLLRRIARIGPAYWLTFLTVVILVPRSFVVSKSQLLLHVALLHGWVPGEEMAIYSVGWTLSVEAMFYLVVPLAAAALFWRKRRWSAGALARGIVIIWVASAAIHVLGDTTFPGKDGGDGWATAIASFGREWIFGWLSLFCPGLLVALAVAAPDHTQAGLWRPYRALARKPGLAILWCAVLGSAAYICLSAPQSWLNEGIQRQMWALAYFPILATVVDRGIRWRGVVRVLAPIGVISYGLYLWHWVVRLALTQPHGITGFTGSSPLAWLGDLVLLVILTIPLAAASWYLVERPAIRRAVRFARRWTSPMPVATSSA